MAVPILMHVCCGPCSIMPALKMLEDGYNIIGYFYNPNIHPLKEFLRRYETAVKILKKLKIRLLFNKNDWNFEKWIGMQFLYTYKSIRCENCISTRLHRTFALAKALNINYVTTSLLFSKYQPHNYIKTLGHQLSEIYEISFYYEDFRKFWQRGEELSKKFDLYRQPYCGCIYSEKERYYQNLQKLENFI